MEAQFVQLLKTNKLKVTPARLGVFSALAKSHEPLDVLQIHQKAESYAGVTIDLATVYRVLQSFLTLRIVKQIEIGEGKYRYELSSLPHHHHAICMNCNKITDIDQCNIATVQKNISTHLNFEITSHDVEFFGYCSSCRSVV
jgi:Fe2+ or Zn2+ uptake regulation protein